MTIDTINKSDNLTAMKEMSVTEVARNFSAVVAEVEAGEEIRLLKGKREVGRLIPPVEKKPNGAAFKAALVEAQAKGFFGDSEFADALQEIVDWRYDPINFQSGLFDEK
jgi:antitoxin (DNA-binding transcriptional repressor) of toxin-antitoxin stability system